MEVDVIKLKRRTERDLHADLGKDYVLDIQKNYLLRNEEEKYDKVPEIWEGHNIADFIDPAIIEVFLSFYSHLCG
jgi:nucleolar GTP-binding protein